LTATSDPVGTALASLGAAATTGAAIITGGTLVRSVQATTPSTVESQTTGFAILWATLVAGIAAAALTGWYLTAALSDAWRRAVVAILSIFGASLLAGLAMPAHMMGGRPALAVYVVALAAAAVYGSRSARRASRQ
jgi:hypothetical protein